MTNIAGTIAHGHHSTASHAMQAIVAMVVSTESADRQSCVRFSSCTKAGGKPPPRWTPNSSPVEAPTAQVANCAAPVTFAPFPKSSCRAKRDALAAREVEASRRGGHAQLRRDPSTSHGARAPCFGRDDV
jgi:hypothetical protein